MFAVSRVCAIESYHIFVDFLLLVCLKQARIDG